MDKLKQITILDNEPFLRQISKEVDIYNDKSLNDDIKVLDDFCKDAEVMAMAAVQLGIPKRLVYLKNTNLDIVNKIQNDTLTEEEKNYNEAKVLIKPVITNRVLRPYIINVEYYDIDGDFHQEKFEGFESTVLSHEIDHLDGILHMDIAEEIIVMPREERKKWRQTHGYKIYSKTGDYSSLKESNNSKVLNKKHQ